MPGPILRFREGDRVTIDVTNKLAESTSIHWHGIILPAPMDGVPDISYPGIAPGATFRYQFKLKQSGTFWYHSHSGFQEQTGHYGPLIVVPRKPEPFAYNCDYVVMLSDWSDENPAAMGHNMVKRGPAGLGSDSPVIHAASEYGPQVDARAEAPQYRLDDPGVGLRNNGRRVLTYADLRNLYPTKDAREPKREIQLHLTGNMARYMWSINGIKYADAEPLRLTYGERLRITFINDTMMNHPMRLRYEIRREFAPYIGLNWNRLYGQSADYAREEGDDVDHVRLVLGARTWF